VKTRIRRTAFRWHSICFCIACRLIRALITKKFKLYAKSGKKIPHEILNFYANAENFPSKIKIFARKRKIFRAKFKFFFKRGKFSARNVKTMYAAQRKWSGIHLTDLETHRLCTTMEYKQQSVFSPFSHLNSGTFSHTHALSLHLSFIQSAAEDV
jgi:hypothetical protein